MSKPSIEAQIKETAINLGFSLCGISQIQRKDKELKHLKNWLGKGHHGQLSYLERNLDKREDPSLLLEDAKSIISVTLNYYPEKKQRSDSYHISKYAYGVDYHYVVKDKLAQLENFINQHYPEAKFRRFVDSAPVFDKTWAIDAGLGWMGKNTMLINPKQGSFFFVGELITDLELKADSAFEKNHCGTCTKCIDACPTNAIEEAYVVNATKCISYHTIEVKDDIPEDLAAKFQDRIFGCDICQDVCPWNKKATPHNEESFLLKDEIARMNKADWEQLSKEEFNHLFKNSPLKRAGYDKITRTIQSLKSI
jgi:epoxyqueuosine reductase